MDAEIIKILTGDNISKLLNEKDLRTANPTSFTATFSDVNEVFCLFTGQIEYMGMDENGLWTMNLDVTNHEIIRYMNMTSCIGNKNQWIEEGTKIGTVVPKRKNFSLEYCSEWKGYSKYPVRICGRTFYKQNPIDILDGAYVPPREFHVSEQYTRPYQTYSFTQDQLDEWYVERDPIQSLLEIDKKAFQINDLQSIPKSFLAEFDGAAGGNS